MSIGEHDTCPYCGHSNLIISKNDAAVKALVEAARAVFFYKNDMVRHTYTHDAMSALEQAIKKVEGL